MTAYLAGVQERLRTAELARVEAQARTEEERKRRKTQFRMAAAILLALALGTAGVAYPVEPGRGPPAARPRPGFGLAREAIERFYTGASEDVLLKEPQFKELREKLLGSSLEFYKKLQASLEAESGGAPRPELAAAYESVGEDHRRDRYFSAGDRGFSAGREIRQRLAEQRRESPEAQAALADVLESRPRISRDVGRAAEAVEPLRAGTGDPRAASR